MKKIAFVGLGNMGFPMAGHLARAGHDICVYNRTTSRMTDWQAVNGGRIAVTPAQAARGADLVFVCVGNDDDVRSVVQGAEGVLAGMRSGSCLVDHTTASAALARELAALCSGQGVSFLDAPVSGGQAGAQNGCLTVMAGGDMETFQRVEPVLAAYAASSRLMGPVGSGQLTKMVNQICVGGLLQALAEALHFG